MEGDACAMTREDPSMLVVARMTERTEETMPATGAKTSLKSNNFFLNAVHLHLEDAYIFCDSLVKPRSSSCGGKNELTSCVAPPRMLDALPRVYVLARTPRFACSGLEFLLESPLLILWSITLCLLQEVSIGFTMFA